MHKLSVIAPSSPFEDSLDKVKARLKKEKIIVDERIGEVPERALEASFRDSSVDAIAAVRGGFGCCKVTDQVDWNAISAHKKPFLGYSDVTILLNRINKETGFVTYHAPVVKELNDLIEDDFNAFIRVVKGDVINDISANSSEGRVLKGLVAGGNLTVMASVVGTEDQVFLDDKILFIEDVGEKLYRIERCLWQLKRSGCLDKVAAIVLGEFVYEESYKDDFQLDVFNLVKSIMPNKLIVNRVEAGHGLRKKIVPIGQEVNILY